MKIFKSLALGALALSSIGAASAQTYIYLTASNGDRTATQTAISKILASGWKFQGINGETASGGTLSTATGANFGAWNGTFNGSPVVIKVSFSGALAGIAAIAGDTDQRFVASDGLGTGTIPNPLTSSNPSDYVVKKADLGLSTNFQTTSPFLGLYENVNYNPINQTIVGVSPLGFYASPGFPATNITTQLAQLLYTTGSVPLSLFTGNFTNGDQNKIVYALGRNTDAGQRFGAYTEVGLGTSTNVKVWQPNYTAGVGGTPQTTGTGGIVYGGVVGQHILWPAETVSGIFSPLGSGGYSSGALITQQLTSVLGPDAYKGRYEDPENPGVPQYLYPNATAGYYVGYATPGDGNPRVLGVSATGVDLGVIPVQNRGVALSYNGVALHNANGSVNEDNVRTGRYTPWLYNRTLKREGATPFTGTPAEQTLKNNFFNQLTTQIQTVDAVQGGGLLNNADFKVQRFTDGGLVVPK